MALAKLIGFLVITVVGLGLASLMLRNLIESNSSGSDDGGPTATTIIDGRSVSLMQPIECDPACAETTVLIGDDEYVLNDDPLVEVLASNVTDEVFAAGQTGSSGEGGVVDLAYIVENVDPAVLLAGRSGSTYVAITGPSIESTAADPTLEVLFVVCVSLVDADRLDQCRALNEPAIEVPVEVPASTATTDPNADEGELPADG